MSSLPTCSMPNSYLPESSRTYGLSIAAIAAALVFLLFLMPASPANAQIGGSRSYGQFELPASARIAALGGYAIATWDSDPALGYANPALYNPAMDRKLVFSHAFGPAEVQYGHAAYAHHLEKPDLTIGGGILYRAYGRFDGRDAAGNSTGGFGAGEYAIHAGTSYRSDRLAYGATLKMAYGRLESYSSFAAAVDLGAAYIDTANRLVAALVLRNVGVPISSYLPGDPEALPFDLQLAISHRLEYLPLRLSLTLHDLYRWDIRYDDPNAPSENDLPFGGGQEEEDGRFIADKIFRHVAISGEFEFGKNLRVRLGYDHQGRGELAATGRSGLTGFSGGFGIRVKQFRLDYAHQITHLSGRQNHLTVTTDIAAFAGP
jgi:hypothetical protein